MRPNKRLSRQYSGDVGKTCDFVRNLDTPIVIRFLSNVFQVFLDPFCVDILVTLASYFLKNVFSRLQKPVLGQKLAEFLSDMQKNVFQQVHKEWVL